MDTPQPRPTLKAVAQRAGVALATASYALHNHPKIPEATRRRVQEAADFLGYRTNATVSRLMSELRSDRREGTTLAWINCNHTQESYQTIPWLRGWLTGARSRADRLGYRLEEFWLREKGMSSERMLKILTTRGIAGIIIGPTRATEGIIPIDIRTFPAVSMAGTFSQPVVHQASTDNYSNVILALREMSRLGYRKIGFFSSVLAREWTDRQHVGAYLQWQEDLPDRFKSTPLIHDENSLGAETIFREWVQTQRFDAILSTSSLQAHWLANMGLRIPDDIGVAHMNLAEDVAGWAGINPRIEEVAAAGVDLLIGHILRHEVGPPSVQKVTNIRGLWVHGRTVRQG